MQDLPDFYDRQGPLALGAIADQLDIAGLPAAAADLAIADVRSLADAAGEHLTFCDNRKYLDALRATRAGACLLPQTFVDDCPDGVVPLVTGEPYRAFARALLLFYPQAGRSLAANGPAAPGGELVHPSARIDPAARIEPGAVVGAEARVGSGAVVAANAVVGFRVTVGQDCYIGPGASVIHAHLGDRVILHAGVRVGQDGFGFVLGPQGHFKVPQVGRVLIGDDVEIGANTTIDRGGLLDTVIGAGTKVDNLVQIGHGVRLGRHCVITSQSGLGGSARLGDMVIMGAASGVLDHVTVGDGALIAGAAHAKDDVAAGAKVGGTPAVPFSQYARELAAVKLLAARRGGKRK